MDRMTLLKGALLSSGPEAVNDFLGASWLEDYQQTALKEINKMLDDVASQMSDEKLAAYLKKYVGKEELRVDVPDGQIVAYPTNDPDYPGIHIERVKDGHSYMLNLATTEYKAEEKRWVTHVWGDAKKEDTTHDIVHENESSYFDQ